MSKHKFRILIVDDEDEALDAMADLIESLGSYQTFRANTVDQAIKLLNKVDAVLADVNMPGKNRLNAILANSQIPVARLSGMEQNVSNFMLQKPYTKNGLSDCLKWLESLSSNNQKLECFIASELGIVINNKAA